jgi:hypothetical protein
LECRIPSTGKGQNGPDPRGIVADRDRPAGRVPDAFCRRFMAVLRSDANFPGHVGPSASSGNNPQDRSLSLVEAFHPLLRARDGERSRSAGDNPSHWDDFSPGHRSELYDGTASPNRATITRASLSVHSLCRKVRLWPRFSVTSVAYVRGAAVDEQVQPALAAV